MGASLPKLDPSTLLNTVETRMAKAEGRAQSFSIASGDIVKEALMGYYGSLKCAAISLKYDLGQLSHDLKTGDFKVKRLDVDPEARLHVYSALYEAVRDDDPRLKRQRALRNVRRALDDLAEAL